MMDEEAPEFRNPGLLQVLPFREWLRNNMPSGRRGFVVEDLDLVIRIYGPRYHLNAQGKFLLAELKFGNSRIGTAQQRTFGLIHQLLRMADPERSIYLGYFVLNYDDEDWDKANFKINRVSVTRDRLIEFFEGNIKDIPEFEFPFDLVPPVPKEL